MCVCVFCHLKFLEDSGIVWFYLIRSDVFLGPKQAEIKFI